MRFHEMRRSGMRAVAGGLKFEIHLTLDVGYTARWRRLNQPGAFQPVEGGPWPRFFQASQACEKLAEREGR
jgi:hypothetical protein